MAPMKKWPHPGGKLRELGADALSDAELLAILSRALQKPLFDMPVRPLADVSLLRPPRFLRLRSPESA